MAFADTQELLVKLDLKGNFSRGLAGATRDLQAFDKATGRTQKSLGKFGRNIEKGLLIGAAAATTGFLAVVKAASDFESAFAGVRKTVTASEEEFQELSDQFRALSKTIPISAAELARLGEAGGALGIGVENLEEFVRVTALLGVTTDLTADQAADSLGILGNVLHLTGEDYERFASSLVALGNAGASTESQIVEIAQRAGAAGELIGLSTDQVLGFASAVASLGIEVEAGGTSLQKFFVESAKQVAAGGDELALFAKVAGESAKDFRKAYEQDAGAALQDFLAGLGKLDQAAQFNILEDLGFGDSRISRALLGLANNTALVADQMNVANQAFKDNTALTKEAEQRFKTFDSQLQITKNVLTDIGITIGSKLLPKLVPLLQRLNAFVTENQGAIEKFGDDLAEGFEKFADAVAKVDWTPFIDGLKLSADLAKGAFDAFRALPEDFQKLILVGAGVNKITGGLLTSIGKDVAGALGAQFLSRGASPANPLWVQMAGGVPGVGAGAGGGGKLGAAANVASLIIPVAIGAEIGKAVAGALGANTATDPELGVLGALIHIRNEFPKVNQHLNGVTSAVGDSAKLQNVTNERLEAIRAQEATAASQLGAKIESTRAETANVRMATDASKAAVSAKIEATRAETAQVRMATERSRETLAARILDTRSEMAAVRAAVNAKKLSVTTNVSVRTSVSVRENITAHNQYKSIYQVAQ